MLSANIRSLSIFGQTFFAEKHVNKKDKKTGRHPDSSHFEMFSGHAKDHILDESPFTGRQSDINYVTHIGSFSSVRQRSVFLSELRDI